MAGRLGLARVTIDIPFVQTEGLSVLDIPHLEQTLDGIYRAVAYNGASIVNGTSLGYGLAAYGDIVHNKVRVLQLNDETGKVIYDHRRDDPR
jgi:hypothetical protein